MPKKQNPNLQYSFGSVQGKDGEESRTLFDRVYTQNADGSYLTTGAGEERSRLALGNILGADSIEEWQQGPAWANKFNDPRLQGMLGDKQFAKLARQVGNYKGPKGTEIEFLLGMRTPSGGQVPHGQYGGGAGGNSPAAAGPALLSKTPGAREAALGWLKTNNPQIYNTYQQGYQKYGTGFDAGDAMAALWTAGAGGMAASAAMAGGAASAGAGAAEGAAGAGLGAAEGAGAAGVGEFGLGSVGAGGTGIGGGSAGLGYGGAAGVGTTGGFGAGVTGGAVGSSLPGALGTAGAAGLGMGSAGGLTGNSTIDQILQNAGQRVGSSVVNNVLGGGQQGGQGGGQQGGQTNMLQSLLGALGGLVGSNINQRDFRRILNQVAKLNDPFNQQQRQPMIQGFTNLMTNPDSYQQTPYAQGQMNQLNDAFQANVAKFGPSGTQFINGYMKPAQDIMSKDFFQLADTLGKAGGFYMPPGGVGPAAYMPGQYGNTGGQGASSTAPIFSDIIGSIFGNQSGGGGGFGTPPINGGGGGGSGGINWGDLFGNGSNNGGTFNSDIFGEGSGGFGPMPWN